MNPLSIHSETMGMKGRPQNGGGGSGGVWMKKKKIAMVAVVILVGVMGVMVVQKVRDRRLFNLVIKDKDRQILSLHLLLQKERQYAKETKRKNQDLNAKLYSLRTQKTELDNKMMEMRSTIGSMRDEQRALEMTIDEKQNEIKNKESKIKDLIQSPPPKIWSVSSDDPSNREINLTAKATTIKSHRESINPNFQAQNPNTTSDGGGLSMKGRSFISGNKSDNKSEGRTMGLLTKTSEYSTKRKDEKMEEDEGEIEVDVSMADQDYKEETED